MAAFRRYQPRSQTNRMVMLFLGLARSAGIAVADAPRERGMSDRPARQTGARPAARQQRNQTETQTGKANRGGTPNEPPAEDVDALFGQLARELTALPDGDFATAWKALGDVAMARARAKAASQPPKAEAETGADSG